LSVDPASGQFVTNPTSNIECFGDVAIKGTLFLNNVTIQTDAGGCRLYVSRTVFIQGPIHYQGDPNANLQITSSSAIVMGFSLKQMGVIAPTATSPQPRIQEPTTSIVTVGGPWARFASEIDHQYNPGAGPINGIGSTEFFDNIAYDALTLGNVLVDAGELGAINNLVPGETISTDTVGQQGSYGGRRVVITLDSF
jgi:hypothetical protein